MPKEHGGQQDENLATRLGPLSAIAALVGLIGIVWLIIKEPGTVLATIVIGGVIGTVLVLAHTSIFTMPPLLALGIVVGAAYFICRND